MTISTKNHQFNFDFSYKNDENNNKCYNTCVYCKCKDNEIKEFKKKIAEKDNEIKEFKKKIAEKDNEISTLKKYINDFIILSQNYKINDIEELKIFIKNNSEFIIDDIMFIDFDVFEYESVYSLKKQIEEYEEQIDTINDIFNDNNVNTLSELKARLSKNFYNKNKYDNIYNILENAKIKLEIQNIKTIELTEKSKELDYKINIVKNNISKLKPGTIIEIKGVKKIYKRKIEKTIDKIKQMEQEVNEYIKSQLSWAKNILKNDIDDEKLIKILDIFNKLINNKYLLPSSDSENDHFKIYNDIKLFEIKKIDQYIKLGNLYINKNINTKKDLSEEDLIFMKEIIKTSDIKYGSKEERINRFINTCKRYYILSQKLNDKNSLINSKCKTYIRDMNNKDFDNLLKLLDNFEN